MDSLKEKIDEKRAVIYVRVSTVEQAEEGHSIEAQKEKCREYCQQRGFRIVEIYSDEGISGGSTKNRKAYQRMMKEAQENKFDMVLIWRLSRLGRNMRDLLETVEIFIKNNVNLVSISDSFDISTSSGRMMFQMLGVFSEFERETISSNVQMSMKSLVRDKKRPAGGRRLGYISGLDSDGRKQLIIQEEEAAIVRLIFHKYLAGDGYRAIANSLNRQGYKTVKDNPFSTCAVKTILQNYQTYNGYLVYAKYEDWSKKRRKGLSKSPIIVKGEHEPIIDDRIAKMVEERLSLESFQPKWNENGQNLLTGLLKCNQCGAPLAASNTYNVLKDGSRKHLRYYSCSRFRSHGSTVCSANSVRADFAEKFVADRLKEIVQVPEILNSIIKELNATIREQIIPLEQELAVVASNKMEIEEKLVKWRSLLQTDPELTDSLAERIADLNQEVIQCRRREEQILSILSNKDKKIKTDDIAALIAGIDQMLENQPKMMVKRIYRTFIKEIHFDKLNKENITITINFSEEIVRQINEIYRETVSSNEDTVSLRYKGFAEVTI